VLVPQNFLDWANRSFSGTQPTASSRVVIKTTDPGNPKLVQYLKENNLVTDADKTRFSKYRQIVTAIVNASWITGAIMLLFALLVFSLFIQLTISAARQEIALLITLGTSPIQLQKFLLKQFMPANFIITVVTVATVAALQWLVQHYLQKQNMNISPIISYYTLITAALILLVLWLVNVQTVKKYIKQTEA
jgi:cell division protein FtsX